MNAMVLTVLLIIVVYILEEGKEEGRVVEVCLA